MGTSPCPCIDCYLSWGDRSCKSTKKLGKEVILTQHGVLCAGGARELAARVYSHLEPLRLLEAECAQQRLVKVRVCGGASMHVREVEGRLPPYVDSLQEFPLISTGLTVRQRNWQSEASMLLAQQTSVVLQGLCAGGLLPGAPVVGQAEHCIGIRRLVAAGFGHRQVLG